MFSDHLLCISTSERMRWHGRKHKKMIKSMFLFMHTRGSRKAHEEKWFSNVFDCCACIRSLVEIHNNHYSFLFLFEGHTLWNRKTKTPLGIPHKKKVPVRLELKWLKVAHWLWDLPSQSLKPVLIKTHWATMLSITLTVKIQTFDIEPPVHLIPRNGLPDLQG